MNRRVWVVFAKVLPLVNVIVFFSLIAISFAAAGQAPIGKLLSRKYQFLTPDEQLTILISFADKGDIRKYSPAKAENFLSQRAINRRLKVRDKDQLIDEQDFPLERSYVSAVEHRVIRIRHELKWFNSVSAVATKRQIEALRNLPFIRGIELVGRWSKRTGDEQEQPLRQVTVPSAPVGTTTLDYGTSFTQLNQIRVPSVHDRGIYGQGIVVGVFDNGFRLLTHEAFGSMNIIAQHDFVDHKESVVPNNTSTGFGSHGVNTLSTVGGYKPGQLIGPAFGSSFILARTENDSSETPIEEDNWAKAIEWADSIGVDVTSTSLGYYAFDSPYTSWSWENMDGNTTVITKAADRAVGLGIVVVNSAGNDAGRGTPNTLVAPADGDSVIAAGAVNSSGVRASFSSYGPTFDGRTKPDIMAMGVGVKVASSTNPTGYSSASGTSFSCPLSAGVAALILCANPQLTPIQVREAMRQTAGNAASPDNFMGWGILNADSAIRYFGILRLGRISGTVFNDLDTDGVRDSNETGTANVAIHLNGGGIAESTFTNAQGHFTFDSLGTGTYSLSEVAPPGTLRTAPVESTYTINLLFAVDTTGLDFGNHGSTTLSVHVDPGWNLLSLPVDPGSHAKSSIYPTAISNAFVYQGGYVPSGSVPNGVGYWLKFDSAQSVSIEGWNRTDETIDVKSGWNMIGTLTSDVPIGSIQQVPGGIVISNYFYYDFTFGYAFGGSPNLVPHRGYWVKCSADGKLTMNSSSISRSVESAQTPARFPANREMHAAMIEHEAHGIFADTSPPWNTVTFTDAQGKHTTLNFGHCSELAANQYELPPPPPGFDVRFESGYWAWIPPTTDSAATVPLYIQNANYPLSVSWKIREDSIRYTLVQIGEGGSESLAYSKYDSSARITDPNTTILLKQMGRNDRSDEYSRLPRDFALDQNYPNPFPTPFNPSTIIRYRLPSVRAGSNPAPSSYRVTLRVYNVLGQVVATLVDGEVRSSGEQSVLWNASEVGSGIYIYRLTAGSFSDVKKLLLIR